MRVLAFDIETVPDFNGINYRDYQYLRSRGKKDKTEEEFTKEFSFNPFTLFVVSVSGVYVSDGGIDKGFVLYMAGLGSSPRVEEVFYAEGRSLEVEYEPLVADFVEGKLYDLEERILERFWERVQDCDLLVSFNGQKFDGYILKIRSMLHDLTFPASMLRDRHIDLMTFLSNGEKSKQYRLDFICRKFNIHTPKDIIDGSKVAEEFYKGNYETIALYNLKDSVALAQLYLKLRKYLGHGEFPTEPFTELQFRKLRVILRKLTELEDEVLKNALSVHFGKRNLSELISLLESIERQIGGSERRERPLENLPEDEFPF